MKKITIIFILLIAQSNFAQNTFPTTGKVGIGTLTPESKFSIYSTTAEGWNSGLELNREDGGKGYIIVDGNGMKFRTPIDGDGFYFRDYDNNTSLFIEDGGNIGIGTTTPESKLDVKGIIKSYEATSLGSLINSSLLLNEHGASCGLEGNRIYNRLWAYRDNNVNANWYTTRLHDGISIDTSYNIPQLDTKTWWERDPYDNIQSWGNAAETYLTINKGNVGIGTIVPDEKLTVKGKIHTQEVRVDMLGALVPDYVFAEDYKLKSLQEVEEFIKQNKHLPEVPSANEIEKNGLMLAEMNMVLLKKMEEMTLYMIEMKKQIEKQNEIIDKIKK